MSKKGDEFHRTVTSIERILHNNPGTSILSPSFEVDRITKQKREHDIVVIHQLGHETIKMAIECKDLARKVDTPIVEAFKTKMNDTQCNKGVIVSSSGFTGPAIFKAKHYNISCLTLSEVEQFPWILTNSVMSVSNAIRSGFVKIITDDKSPRNPKLFERVGDTDLRLEKENLNNLITNALTNVINQQNLMNIRASGQMNPVAGVHKMTIKIINLNSSQRKQMRLLAKPVTHPKSLWACQLLIL